MRGLLSEERVAEIKAEMRRVIDAWPQDPRNGDPQPPTPPGDAPRTPLVAFDAACRSVSPSVGPPVGPSIHRCTQRSIHDQDGVCAAIPCMLEVALRFVIRKVVCPHTVPPRMQAVLRGTLRPATKADCVRRLFRMAVHNTFFRAAATDRSVVGFLQRLWGTKDIALIQSMACLPL